MCCGAVVLAPLVVHGQVQETVNLDSAGAAGFVGHAADRFVILCHLLGRGVGQSLAVTSPDGVTAQLRVTPTGVRRWG